MAKRDETGFAKNLSSFLDAMEQAKRDYHYNFEQVGVLDRLTQDYLHKLELEQLDHKQRAKVATQLRDCRRRRREHKNAVEVLAPTVEFLESDRGKQYLNTLREVLGSTRRLEGRLGNRVYIPRVLEE